MIFGRVRERWFRLAILAGTLTVALIAVTLAGGVAQEPSPSLGLLTEAVRDIGVRVLRA